MTTNEGNRGEDHYTRMARDSLTHVLDSLLQELLQLGGKIAGDNYKSEEGIVADAERLCEVAQGIHSCTRVMSLLAKKRALDTDVIERIRH